MRTILFTKEENVFTFFSDLGVFSKNKIDYGSKLLLNTILKNNPSENQKILDIGCGYGFLGICLGKILKSQADFSDVNERALWLCAKNIQENQVNGQVIKSNTYEKITEKYDMIVTNPPIRAGKIVVLDILLNAKDYLNSNGTVWFVIRKDQGAKSIVQKLEGVYEITNMAKDKGFYIFKAKMR